MGGQGPVPNRSGDLSRKRDANRGDRPDLKTGLHYEPNIPEAGDWCHTAMLVWDSFANSGQSDFWQESDWSYAYVICEWLNRLELDPTARGSAQNMATILQGMTNLMMTEAERRRARVELERPKPQEVPRSKAAVTDLRERLKG